MASPGCFWLVFRSSPPGEFEWKAYETAGGDASGVRYLQPGLSIGLTRGFREGLTEA